MTTTTTQSQAKINPRNPTDHALIGSSASLPIPPPVPYISIAPLILPNPDRPIDIHFRITFPKDPSDTDGSSKLPLILLSHGHGPSNNLSSLNGYGPLATFYASHGFAVIQPTHLTSRSLVFPPDTPGGPWFWRERVQDFSFILDHLSDIESQINTELKGRTFDRDRIAVIGHSMGTHTAGLLLGLTIVDPDTNENLHVPEPRIKTGILIGAAGAGGDSLTKYAYDNFPFFRQPTWQTLTTPTLVVAASNDENPRLSTRGPSWSTDPYHLAPAGTGKALFTVYGGGHGIGGVSGWDAKEAGDDESPERVAAVQRVTWGWLRSRLYDDDKGKAWEEVTQKVAEIGTLGKIETK